MIKRAPSFRTAVVTQVDQVTTFHMTRREMMTAAASALLPRGSLAADMQYAGLSGPVGAAAGAEVGLGRARKAQPGP